MDGLISDKNHHRALNDSLNSDKNSLAVVLYSQDEGAFSETAAILETFQEKWECKMLFEQQHSKIPDFVFFIYPTASWFSLLVLILENWLENVQNLIYNTSPNIFNIAGKVASKVFFLFQIKEKYLKMGSTGINHLPPELLCKIFSNLSISSKLACRAVSATWNDIVSLSSELWPGENLEPFSVPKNMLKFSWSLFLFLKVC